MKYVIFLGDGMADLPVPALGGKTPLEEANHPAMDRMAQNGLLGLARTVPSDMPVGSDIANLAVLGYDPKRYYSGRSPFEAISMGVELAPEDVTYRCNLVTVSGAAHIADAAMLDYSAGEIDSDSARPLIAAMQERFGNPRLEFHAGISYRHCLVLRGGRTGTELTPPHDITGQPLKGCFPAGENGDLLREMINYSYRALAHLPVNKQRVAAGLAPANAVWFWGEGRKPNLPLFRDKYDVRGGIISAVDLLHGIGKCAGLESIPVAGITGNFHTDFAAKGNAAIAALRGGLDFVYIHVEAPDECGHHGQVREKIWSIEQIDQHIVAPVLSALDDSGEDYAALLLPDHPTPLERLTHTHDPVPFALYRKGAGGSAVPRYTEANAAATGLFVEQAFTLMDQLLK